MNELKFPFSFTCKADKQVIVYKAEQDFAGNVIVTWTSTGPKSANYGNVERFKETFEGFGETTIIATDPDVTVKQSELDSYIDEINMLRELVAEITLPTDFSSLEQQAEVFRDLNDKMIKHQSFVDGDGSRRDELLTQLDVLFAAYDSLACNSTAITPKEEFECKFKPISEMTSVDWKQAKEEGWAFDTEGQGVVTIRQVDNDSCPVLLKRHDGDTWWVRANGYDLDKEGYTVTKRIK